MTDEKFDLTQLTEENIDSATTLNLRGWAEAAKLSDWNVRVSVATLTLDSDAVSTPGLMTAIDALVQKLLKAYAARGARVKKSYGDSLEVQVYAEDVSLRHALKRERQSQLDAKTDDSE